MYFKEKTTKIIEIRIIVWEFKLSCVNKDWLWWHFIYA